jgi:hypothetical protein
MLGVAPMTETEQFLATMGPRITAAEIALHNGDSGPRIAMWSRAEPLTLLGAAISGRGWREIGPIFGWPTARSRRGLVSGGPG